MADRIELVINRKKWTDCFSSMVSWIPSKEKTVAKIVAVRVSRTGFSYDLGIHVRLEKIGSALGKLVFWIINENYVPKSESRFFQNELETFVSQFGRGLMRKPSELYVNLLWVDNLGVVEFPLQADWKASIVHFEEGLRLICEFYCDKIAKETEGLTVNVPDPSPDTVQKRKDAESDLPDWLKGTPGSWKKSPPEKPVQVERTNFRLSDMGGNAQLKTEIVKLISFHKNREHFSSWNIQPPKGVLLYGPPGTGKTLAAKIIANELEQPMFTLSPSDILTSFYGESSGKLKRFFSELPETCVVFIDEIDGLVPNRSWEDGKESPHEETQRVINQFLQEMDGFHKSRDILFIGATNRIEALDPAILRAGRFDYKILVGYPDLEARKEIWKIYLEKAAKNSRHAFLDDGVDLDTLAKETERFTWAEIREVVRRMLSDYAIGSLFSEKVKTIVNGKTTALWLLHTIKTFREEKVVNQNVIPEKTGLQLADIAWSNDLKTEIRNLITQIRNPEIFEKYGAEIPRWLLLYGPPGTGKTHAGKVIASELGIPFYLVNFADVTSKWHNESHRNLKAVFEWLQDPCVVFFDEIDAIAWKRSDAPTGGQTEDVKVLNTLLMEMDGFDKKRRVLFIGTTNRIDALDPAILRAGRFDAKIFVWLPDEEARKELFEMYAKRWTDGSVIGEVDSGILSENSEWMTPGDVKEIARRAKRTLALKALGSSNVEKITTETLLRELESYKKSNGSDDSKRRIGFDI